MSNKKSEEKETLKTDEELNDAAENEKEEVKDGAAEEQNQIAQLEQEVAELKDRYLRKVAEFENYKRRTDNDQLNLLKYAAESFIIKLLPVVDDFERSLKHIDTAQDMESLKKGIQLVYEKLMKVLNDQGIKKIEAAGKEFDVNYHEALMKRKEEGAEGEVVLDELETGYMYKDRVIRHTKVIVNEV
jgi:molecular chaperone GrpE